MDVIRYGVRADAREGRIRTESLEIELALLHLFRQIEEKTRTNKVQNGSQWEKWRSQYQRDWEKCVPIILQYFVLMDLVSLRFVSRDCSVSDRANCSEQMLYLIENHVSNAILTCLVNWGPSYKLAFVHRNTTVVCHIQQISLEMMNAYLNDKLFFQLCVLAYRHMLYMF